MGGSSIWQWIIVLLVLSIFAVGVRYAPTEYRVARLRFAVVSVGVAIALVVLNGLVARLVQSGAEWSMFGSAALAIFALWYLGRLTAGRCKDCKVNRWWSLAIFLPIAGIAVFVLLVARASRGHDIVETSADEAG